MKRSIFSFFLALVSVQSFGAGSAYDINNPPTETEVVQHLPKQVCYDIVVKTTSLSPVQHYPETRIPLCVDLSTFYNRDHFPEMDNGCNSKPGINYGDGTVCHWQPVGDATPFVDAMSPGYTFKVQVAERESQESQFIGRGFYGSYVGYHSEYGLVFVNLLDMSTDWDYRLNKILAANADQLPVKFSTLLIPSVDSTLSVEDVVTWLARDSRPVYRTQLLNTFKTVRGVGYDTSHAEYDVEISIQLSHMVFP